MRTIGGRYVPKDKNTTCVARQANHGVRAGKDRILQCTAKPVAITTVIRPRAH